MLQLPFRAPGALTPKTLHFFSVGAAADWRLIPACVASNPFF
jgi:hypothetical protein